MKFLICILLCSCILCSCKSISAKSFTANDGITWEEAKDIIPGNYPRMAELKDGSLMLTFEHGIKDGVAISFVKSFDDGVTWSKPTQIAFTTNGHDFANAFPLQLQNGRILVAFRDHIPLPNKDVNYRLPVYASDDNGKTWHYYSIVEDYKKTSHYLDGVWEPIFLQLPNGELQCYYADGRDHGIVMRYSKDNGKTWSKKKIKVATCKKGDGMPGIVQLPDGTIVVDFESGETDKQLVVVRCAFSKDNGRTWTKKRPLVYEAHNKSGKAKWSAAAPAIAQLKDGRLIASFQTDENVKYKKGDKAADPSVPGYDPISKSVLKYVTSEDNGKTWSENAIWMMGTVEDPALWNYVFVSKKGIIYMMRAGVKIRRGFPSEKSSKKMFSNKNTQVKQCADPFILKHKDTYYLYCTADTYLTDLGIPVYKSKDLVNWEGPCGKGPNGLALYKDDVWGNRMFWAGDVIEKNGKFYMFPTAEEHLIVAVSDSPLGPFKQKEKKPMHKSPKEIDGSVFIDDNGKAYIYFIRLDGGNKVYVAELSKDLLSMKDKTIKFCLESEEGTWERGPNKPRAFVTEGAYTFKHNGYYYLTYTANHFVSKDYAVGYATSKKPTGPWKKYKGNPILSATEKIHGPGNGMFILSPNGEEMFIAYHVHNSTNSVWPRKLALDRAYFKKNPKGGPDILVINGPTVDEQPAPE